MIAQYTQAAMVAENRRLAAPASVDSLPTQRDAGGPRLDGVGCGAQAARVVENLARILAVELAVAARALDLRAPLEPAPGTAAALASLRERRSGPGPGPLAGAGAQ